MIGKPREHPGLEMPGLLDSDHVRAPDEPDDVMRFEQHRPPLRGLRGMSRGWEKDK